MEQEPTEITCPKCGAMTRNAEICDLCGVIISRVQERQAGGLADSVAPAALPDNELPRSGGLSLTLKIVLAGTLVLAAVIGYVTYINKPAKTPSEFVAAHRKITKQVHTMFAGGIPDKADVTLEKMRGDVSSMRPPIESLRPETPAQRFQKSMLLRANAELDKALAEDADQLSLRLDEEENEITAVESLLDDAAHPEYAMQNRLEEAQTKALKQIRERSKTAMSAARREMEANESSQEVDPVGSAASTYEPTITNATSNYAEESATSPREEPVVKPKYESRGPFPAPTP